MANDAAHSGSAKEAIRFRVDAGAVTRRQYPPIELFCGLSLLRLA